MDNPDFSDGKVYTEEKIFCEVCKKSISLYDKYDCQMKFKNRFFCYLHIPHTFPFSQSEKGFEKKF